MTPDEREQEMRGFLPLLEVKFGIMQARMERLVGRPVWTHELGLNFEGLCKEARWENAPATMQSIIELIPEEKRIIIQ